MTLTKDAVERAEAALREAKAAFRADRGDDGLRAAYEEAADTCSSVRSAWRDQEAQAGRRVGLVGGDADATEEEQA